MLVAGLTELPVSSPDESPKLRSREDGFSGFSFDLLGSVATSKNGLPVKVIL